MVKFNLLDSSTEELIWFLESCNVKELSVELVYDKEDLVEANLVHPRK